MPQTRSHEEHEHEEKPKKADPKKTEPKKAKDNETPPKKSEPKKAKKTTRQTPKESQQKPGKSIAKKAQSTAPKHVRDGFVAWLESWEGGEVSNKEIYNAEKAVVDHVHEDWRRKPEQFEALVAIAHDSGAHALTSPHNPLGRILRQQYRPSKERNVGLALQMMARNVSPDRPRPGLPARRRAQSQLYLDGEYNHRS